MNLLQEGHHTCCQQADVILVGWPDDNHIKFLLKVTNLYNSLGLAYIKHPAHQDETTVNLVPLNLINEREVILVGKKRLIG